jgi:hypothetical protein
LGRELFCSTCQQSREAATTSDQLREQGRPTRGQQLVQDAGLLVAIVSETTTAVRANRSPARLRAAPWAPSISKVRKTGSYFCLSCSRSAMIVLLGVLGGKEAQMRDPAA